MTTTDAPFPHVCFVKARLLNEPVYREDGDDWVTLRTQQDSIRHYFRQIGQELLVDEAEGYGFLRQLAPEGDERVPRLGHQRPLAYLATLLLVCLREEFLRFDVSPGESTRLVRTDEELRNLMINYLPDSTNQLRDNKKLDQAITKLTDMRYLRKLDSPDQIVYEVMRIVKARIGPSELEEIGERLRRHAESDT
ncbi:MAG: DUF4194 domain-containing protein [Gemmatimonadetes bacterium]|nr:DUF4194 domain-containing protein [Gemmatimonadota bacterium]